jgi:hypothetical protein
MMMMVGIGAAERRGDESAFPICFWSQGLSAAVLRSSLAGPKTDYLTTSGENFLQVSLESILVCLYIRTTACKHKRHALRSDTHNCRTGGTRRITGAFASTPAF